MTGNTVIIDSTQYTITSTVILERGCDWCGVELRHYRLNDGSFVYQVFVGGLPVTSHWRGCRESYGRFFALARQHAY